MKSSCASAISTRASRGRLRTQCAAGPSRGLSVLEWTGKLIPQGLLVTGVKAGWRTTWTTLVRELAPQDRTGGYVRPSYQSAGRISNMPGSEFPVESGRYHLYVGNACPWCHRVLMAVALRGLDRHIGIIECISDAERASRGGWVFDEPEPVFGCRASHGFWQLLLGPAPLPFVQVGRAPMPPSDTQSPGVPQRRDLFIPGLVTLPCCVVSPATCCEAAHRGATGLRALLLLPPVA